MKELRKKLASRKETVEAYCSCERLCTCTYACSTACGTDQTLNTSTNNTDFVPNYASMSTPGLHAGK